MRTVALLLCSLVLALLHISMEMASCVCNHLPCLSHCRPVERAVCRYVPMFGDTDYDPTCAFTYVPFEEQVEALAAAQRAGKIRRWGVSNETPWGLARWVSVARDLGAAGPAVVQNAYNLLCRNADAGLVEACAHERIELQAYSPLAMGLLTGKYTAVAASELERSDSGAHARACPEALLQSEGAAAGHVLTSERSAEAPMVTGAAKASVVQGQDHDRGAHELHRSSQQAGPLAWDGPAGARLIRYRHRYAEAEARCAVLSIAMMLLLDVSKQAQASKRL